MRLVIQRVTRASVSVDGQRVASIDRGMMILCGVGKQDTIEDAEWSARKAAQLRIFEDADGRMNLPLESVQGQALVVSQFTLYGDCRKGNRPGFTEAADPETGDRLYRAFADALARTGVPVKTGIFRAMMQVELVNDGPVTLIVDSGGRAGIPG